METIEIDSENSPSASSDSHMLGQIKAEETEFESNVRPAVTTDSKEIEYIVIKEERDPAAGSNIEQVPVKQEMDPETQDVTNSSNNRTELQEGRNRELLNDNFEKSGSVTSEHIHFLLGTIEESSHQNDSTQSKESSAVASTFLSYKQTEQHESEHNELSDDSHEESDNSTSNQTHFSLDKVEKTSRKCGRTHTKEDPKNETSLLQSNDLINNMTVDNDECPYTKKSKSTKKRQMNSRHENAFVCRICGKPFSYYSSFSRHMRTHTGERPFICSDCDKSFTVKNHLICHMRVHTGERPFICSICKKLFTQKASLDNHMRTHTGERPFVCTVCSKSFCQSSNLSKHMRTHT